MALSASDRLRVIVEDSQTVWRRGLFFAVLAIAAVVLASRLGRRWAAVAPRRRHRLRALRARAVRYLREESRPVPDSGMDGLSSEPLRTPSRIRGCSRIDGKLYPNTAGALGLQDIRVLDALYVERYWRYVQNFIRARRRSIGSPEGRRGRRSSRDNPMFDALGVRAVLSERDLANVPALRFARPGSRYARVREHERISTGLGRARRSRRRGRRRSVRVSRGACPSHGRRVHRGRVRPPARGRRRARREDRPIRRCARCRTGGPTATRRLATGRPSSATPDDP